MGSCYSTEKRLVNVPQSKFLNGRPTQRISNQKEKLIKDSPRNLRRSRRKNFQPKNPVENPQLPINKVKNNIDSIENNIKRISTFDNTDGFLNIYSDLPLINLSESQTSPEDYDNSSLNFSDYITQGNENTVYTENTKSFYPFPLSSTDSPGFDCRIYNRIDQHILMASRSISANYNNEIITLNHQKFSNGSSSISDSLAQNITSSDSSFSYSNSNSNSISPQNTLLNNMSSQNKPSLLQQPVASKLNRFGFKPGLNTNTAPTVSSTQPQQVKTIKKSETPPIAPNSQINDTNINKLYIEEKSETKSQSSGIQNSLAGHARRAESPCRSFLKPPTKTLISNHKTQKTDKPIEAKSVIKTNGHISKKLNIQESSSMSSLASSSSSTHSTRNKSVSKTDLRNSPESSTNNISNIKQVKSGLLNSKVGLKKTEMTNKTVIQQPSLKIPVTNTKTNISPKLQFQSNLIKPPSLAVNNNNNQHKRRLFNPYMPNPNILSTNKDDNSDKTDNNINKESNDINNNFKENNILKPNDSIVKNIPDEKLELVKNSNIQNEQKSHKFKLYNSHNQNMTKCNVVQAFKSTKMPVKSTSASSKLMQTGISNDLSKNKNIGASSQTGSLNNKFKIATKLQEKNKNFKNGSQSVSEDLLRREDSAYCSSTSSSTVSSQEVDTTTGGKISINNLAVRNSIYISNDLTNVTQEVTNVIDQEVQIDEKGNDEQNKLTNAIIESTEIDKNKNENLKSPIDLESNDEILSDNELKGSSQNSCTNTPNKKLSKRNSIKESIGELNQLMCNASVGNGTPEETKQGLNNNIIRQRRISSTSLSHASVGSSSSNSVTPMFRPPSNLKPVENSEVIELDIETYRQLLQELQNTKTILYKLVNVLREPSSDSFNNINNSSSDVFDENQMTNSMIGCLTQITMNDKIDQTTQTD